MAEGGKNGNLSEQISEIAECPICTERIHNNRLLPCGHTFCLKCLEQYKRATKAKGKSLPCPVCRRDFVIPKGGCIMFPKNIIVDKLLGVENPSKDESDVKLCDTCDEEHIANAHCIECDQNLCTDCEKLHGKLKVSAAHHVLPVSKKSHFKDFPRRSQHCEHHSELTLELMCEDCNVAICWKCRSLSHANHRASDIKDTADGCCEQLQSNILDIDKRLSVLSKIAENIKDQEKQYQENFAKEKANVSKTGADLIRSVVANEEKLIRQLASALQKDLKTLQPHKLQVQAQLDSLRQHKAMVEQLKQRGNSLDIVNRTNELHDTANQLLSLSIININEPTLSTLTEAEIHKELIGFNVAPAIATSTLQAINGANSKGKSLPPPPTLRKPDQRQSLSIQKPTRDDVSMDAANESLSTSTSQTGASFKSKSLPPATSMKPDQRQSLPVPSPRPTRDDTRINVAAHTSFDKTPNPEIYSNLPSSPLSSSPPSDPPPQLPPRLNLPPTPSSSETSTQSAKGFEQQPSVKDIATGIASSSSVASFSVGGGSAVTGVAVHKQKIYVATENNPEISVYSNSDDDHRSLHTLVIPGLKQASDLTFCPRNNCLYLIDWTVRSIFRAELEGSKEITNWSTDGDFGGLSASGDASVVLAGHETNSLKEYTTRGTLLKAVKLKSDVSESIRPWHAVKLSAEKFVVSHGSSSDTALHRVCLVDSTGQVIKSFGGLRGRDNNSLCGPYHLCLTEENKLFIADCNNGRVVIIDANLEFVGELSGSLRKPRRICLDKTSNKLFVTDNRLLAKKASDGRIVIFSQVL